MEMPKCKHNVTLDSECADCIEIKTDNSQVLINQDKKIAELEQKHRDSCYAWREAFDKMHQRAMKAERSCKLMGSEMDEFAKNTLMLGGEIKGLEQKLDEQIAYSELLEGFVIKCVRVYSWGGDVVDGGDIQDWADELGIIKKVAFDSSKHDDGWIGMDEGDSFYELTNQSPAQSLKQIKADAQVEVIAACSDISANNSCWQDAVKEMEELANQILKGES